MHSTEQLHLPPTASYPYHVLATRHSPSLQPPRAPHTLVFLHALGTHKETWDPVVAALLAGAPGVREVYSIEAPNQGDSSVLNDGLLARDRWTASDYADAAQRVIEHCGLARRALVGIGHSMGGSALILLATRTFFRSLILIEAPVTLSTRPERYALLAGLTPVIWTRRSLWPTRAAAEKELAAQIPYNTWDAQVLASFLKHGIQPHRAANFAAPANFNGVITALSRAHEAAAFRDMEHVTLAIDALKRLVADNATAVHLVYGAVEDFSPNSLKRHQAKETSARSVTWVAEYGHFIVQQAPERTAEIIGALMGLGPSEGVRMPEPGREGKDKVAAKL